MEAARLKLDAEGEALPFKEPLEAIGVNAVNVLFIPFDHQMYVGVGQRRLPLRR